MAQEKLKTMLMQNFGVTNKEHYGMLWYFLEWSIVVSSAAVFVYSRDAPTQDASFQLVEESRYATNFHRECKRYLVIPPGGYFRNFWVGMYRWDPGIR